ncbi:glycosyltransferase [Dyadobacter flavalbus]|uniref:Glycosyltransferase n=1 Tax=Dyadobacter flavalbus TaxID=2579942 RepID=A0A5M8QRM3_9BACT|nr:glycosyltransferase [Dyadobacter flavalbus]KAA6438907.1 glycosyltransferase [Dyadobacter flavalbus]
MENQANVTVILTVWKRNHLREQIEALLSQSTPPAHIWVIQCMQHLSIKHILKDYPQVKYFQSDEDLKYFSRFSIGIHVRSEFTWILDDDIIPSAIWIEKCISTCRKYNAIVSSNGRIIPKDDFYPEKVKGIGYTSSYFIGDSVHRDSVNRCDADTVIDFPCSSYFFKTEWLRYFWGIWPLTLETAEDIHFAASCRILGNIPVVVPRQQTKFDSGNIRPDYSLDEHASWMRGGFAEARSEVIKYFVVEKGWKPLLW